MARSLFQEERRVIPPQQLDKAHANVASLRLFGGD